MTGVRREAVFWWDETHQDANVGFKHHKIVNNNKQMFLRFPKDDNGRAVGEDKEGTYSEDADKK